MSPASFRTETDPAFTASGATDAEVAALIAAHAAGDASDAELAAGLASKADASALATLALRVTDLESAPPPSVGSEIVEVWRTTAANWQNGFAPWVPGDAGQALFILYANGFIEAQIPQLLRMGDPTPLNQGIAAPAGDGMRSYMILDNVPDRFSVASSIGVTASSHTWAVFGNATADIVPGIEYYLGTFGAAPDTGQLWVDTNVNFAGRSASYVAHPSVMLRYPTDIPEVGE